jgi:hypothetical protein
MVADIKEVQYKSTEVWLTCILQPHKFIISNETHSNVTPFLVTPPSLMSVAFVSKFRIILNGLSHTEV